MAKRTRKRYKRTSERALVTKPSVGLFRSKPLSVGYSRSVPVRNKQIRRLYAQKQMVERSRPVKTYEAYRKAREKITSPFSSGFAMLKEKV